MRYPGFDYSQYGSYFITICTKNKENLFWNMNEVYDAIKNEFEHIVNFELLPLNYIGDIIDKNIRLWQNSYENVEIPIYVIMPDHIHLIVSIIGTENGNAEKNPQLSRMVAQFKGKVTKELGKSIWQKNYFDHIIVNEKDYNNCIDYIVDNPYVFEKRILETRNNLNNEC